VLPAREVNDARIIAEVANEKIGWLVTSDNKILDAGRDPELRKALQDAGLANVTPVSPRIMARRL
jgi:hypothetical protein